MYLRSVVKSPGVEFGVNLSLYRINLGPSRLPIGSHVIQSGCWM